VTAGEYGSFIETLRLNPQSHVLEVASGSGGPALHLAAPDRLHRHGRRCERCGCTAWGTARALATRAGLANRLKFMVADATRPLPFEDNTFDALAVHRFDETISRIGARS
jgi:ubiquinone/menaquinone biosynthesis C-methylase UbiE